MTTLPQHQNTHIIIHTHSLTAQNNLICYLLTPRVHLTASKKAKWLLHKGSHQCSDWRTRFRSFQEEKKANSRSIWAYCLESKNMGGDCIGVKVLKEMQRPIPKAFDGPETKDVGPAGARRGSKETEPDRWRLFWVWQEESGSETEGEVDNSQQSVSVNLQTNM